MKTLIVEKNNNNNDKKPNGNDSCNGLHSMVNGLIQTRRRKKSTHVSANSDRVNHNKIKNQNQVNNCKEQQQHQFISEWT